MINRRFLIRWQVVCLAGLLAVRSMVILAAEPAETPPLRVQVDPRIELVSLIFYLAGNPEYGGGRVASYKQDAEKHFKPYDDHAVVKLARTLRNTRGVCFDAPMSMAVYLSDAEKLQERVPFDPRPDGLDGRWPLDGLRQFLGEGRKFAKESRFPEFLASHRPLYETIEARMKALLEKEAHLEWYDEFFGVRPQAAFLVVPSMLNGPSCYGAHCRLPHGKMEFYCILGVWQTDDQGLPVFSRGMLSTVVHEFCHSYANPIIDRNKAALQAAGEKIFPHVAAGLKRQAYGNWQTMMYESLVRACTIRHIRRYQGVVVAWTATQQEKSRQFVWMDGLVDLLGEYEAQRDRYPTLDKFAPRIVEFFNKYADSLTPE
jgi:hypothetical protein